MPSLKIDKEGKIIVNGILLTNCMIDSISVSGGVIMKEDSTEGESGKIKTFDGYDDTSITLHMTFYDHATHENTLTSRYSAVSVLNTAFKTLEGKTPAVYVFDFPLAKSMRITSGIIKKINVASKKANSTLICSVELIEYAPDIGIIQDQKTKAFLSKMKTELVRSVKEELVRLENIILEPEDTEKS